MAVSLPMRRLDCWESLEALKGVTSESADLDFKDFLQVGDEARRIEIAKDVAAMANVLGGHVVVGTTTDLGGTRCTGFRGLSAEDAKKLPNDIERAVGDRCRPAPAIAVRTFAMPSGRVVLTVQAEASPVAPIGVGLSQTGGGQLVDKGWAFPYRVGSQTVYLSPDQFGAYESMSARRAAALLQGIPEDQRSNVVVKWVIHRHSGEATRDAATLETKLEGVNLSENVAIFRNKGLEINVVSVPLDAIITAWRDGSRQRWYVSIRGILSNNGTRAYEYVTMAGD